MFSQKKVLRKNYFENIFPRKCSPMPPLHLYRTIVLELFVYQEKWTYKQRKLVKKGIFWCYFRKKIHGGKKISKILFTIKLLESLGNNNLQEKSQTRHWIRKNWLINKINPKKLRFFKMFSKKNPWRKKIFGIFFRPKGSPGFSEIFHEKIIPVAYIGSEK